MCPRWSSARGRRQQLERPCPLARVFAVDVTVCRKYGGRMRILEVVDTPRRNRSCAPRRPRAAAPATARTARAPSLTRAAHGDALDLVRPRDPPDAAAQEIVPFVTHRRSPSSPDHVTVVPSTSALQIPSLVHGRADPSASYRLACAACSWDARAAHT